MRRSAALTIAHRHKQKTAKWATNMFGKELTIKWKHGKTGKEQQVCFLMPKPSGCVNFKSQNLNEMLVQVTGVSLPQSLRAIGSIHELKCCIPNCPNQAEHWHHVKHRKKIKGHDRKRLITAYTAKQIPICKEHHVNIDKGKYDGPSLRKMKGYVPNDFE